ncbi:MAG TPA: hypothetical protein PLY87_01555 [Planctomycetaceae bacterium]|nr:hypothetical protein [Planctomycetaceae bacterium]
MYFVLTQQSLNLLRDFPDSVILKLREISGVTYKTAQEIISIATDPDSVLTEEQLNVLRNAFTRTTDKNPRFINRPPTPSELCEIDKLIRSIIHNHVPERGTFTELPLTGQEIIKVGRRLEDCIKMTRTNCEETPYKFSTCGVLINGIGFEELTNDEQVRLIDYLYLQQPTNVDDATPSAQHYSRVDGWTKLRLRKCFSALLGIDLLNRAAETLRTHIDAGTLPPGGLLALLFTEEDAKQIWNREEFLSSLAFDYHYCGYPMRRLMTLKRKKHYQKRLDQLQQDQHVVAPDLLNQDLQNHWKETCSVVNEAFLSIGKQICRKEA